MDNCALEALMSGRAGQAYDLIGYALPKAPRCRGIPAAAIAGASERSIMKQTGHRSVQMVRRYIREGSLFRENSAAKLGL